MQQSAGNTVTDRAGLAGRTAAFHVDVDIELGRGFSQNQWL